jgi:hypothetical protein
MHTMSRNEFSVQQERCLVALRPRDPMHVRWQHRALPTTPKRGRSDSRQRRAAVFFAVVQGSAGQRTPSGQAQAALRNRTLRGARESPHHQPTRANTATNKTLLCRV